MYIILLCIWRGKQKRLYNDKYTILVCIHTDEDGRGLLCETNDGTYIKKIK